MDSRTQKSLLLEHEIVADGDVVYKERKELSSTTNAGSVRSTLTHTRWIGDKSYEVKKIVQDGKTVDTIVDTKLTAEEAERFQSDWRNNWKPTIPDERSRQLLEDLVPEPAAEKPDQGGAAIGDDTQAGGAQNK